MPQNYDACFPATTPPTVYTNTGTTTAFAVGFPSLKQNDIVVFTGSDADSTWTIVDQTDYAVNSQNANNVQQVVFTAAPGADVLIMRRTDLCVLVRTFQAGQSIRAQDLNNSFLQQLYLSQEMYEFLRSQFGVDDLNPGEPSLDDTFWNKDGDTIASGEAWVSDDDHIATTAAGDARWLNSTGDLQEGDGITLTEAGGNVTISQETLNPDPSGTFANPIVTVDTLGRVTNVIEGAGGGEGLLVIANTRDLNTLAATLGADDAGTAVLVNDSTNIDGTVGTPGANNPAPNPAVGGLPANAPAGGWNDTVQTSLQWTGTAWQFIRFGSANPDQRYINAVDGAPNTVADRQTIRFNGLDLAAANNGQGDPIVGYEMRFTTDGNRTPQFQINAGTTENAEFQLAFGDQGGGVNTHGIYMNCGSTVTRAPRATFTGSVNDNTTIMEYANVNGATAAVGRWELRSNGDIQTNGDIILSDTNARVGVPQFDINISATPTEDYTITLPPTGPAEAGQVLVTDANGQLAWGAGGGAGTVIGPIANFTNPQTGQTNIPPGGQLFDNDANRLYISVETEPDGNGNTANVLVQLVP